MVDKHLLKTPSDLNGMENILKNNKFILIKASATWCNPCKKIEEPFKRIVKNKLDNKVKVMYVDVDDDDDIVNLFKITKLPTFISIVKGKVANTDITSNVKDIKQIVDKLNSHAVFG
jgi:thiol-disulfide isomerase/thioredoxin